MSGLASVMTFVLEKQFQKNTREQLPWEPITLFANREACPCCLWSGTHWSDPTGQVQKRREGKLSSPLTFSVEAADSAFLPLISKGKEFTVSHNSKDKERNRDLDTKSPLPSLLPLNLKSFDLSHFMVLIEEKTLSEAETRVSFFLCVAVIGNWLLTCSHG